MPQNKTDQIPTLGADIEWGARPARRAVRPVREAARRRMRPLPSLPGGATLNGGQKEQQQLLEATRMGRALTVPKTYRSKFERRTGRRRTATYVELTW